ncbi:MAG: histidine kinase [Clostridiales bacterium]|nr:histidine kinase [Clostridiales bacterium]
MNIKKISISIKFLLILLFGIILLYGFSVYQNYTTRKRLNNEFLFAVTSKMEHYISVLENNIDSIVKVQELYSHELDLNMLSYGGAVLSEYEKLQIIRNLQKDLFRNIGFSHLIKSANVDIPALEKTVNSHYQYLDWDERKYDFLWRQSLNMESRISAYRGLLYVSKSYPVYFKPDAGPSYVVYCELDREKLIKELAILCESSYSTCYLMSRDGAWSLGTGAQDSADAMEVSGLAPGQYYTDSAEEKRYVESRESESLGIRLVSLIPERYIRQNGVVYTIQFAGISVMALLVASMYIGGVHKLLRIPMKTIMDAFTSVKAGDLSYRIQHNRGDEYAFLYNGFNDMMKNIHALTAEVTKQEKLVSQAELRQLQYQINPHFLYNSLYVIYRLAASEELETIQKLSQYLGGYYRYITRIPSQLIELAREIEHCRNYLEIQKYRFGNRVTSNYREPRQVPELMVPVLVLQPIVENAFEYAAEKSDGQKIIDVRLEEMEDKVVFTVEDNGGDVTGELLERLRGLLANGESGEVTGMINVHRRLVGRYGERAGVRIEKSGYGGLKVSVIMLKGEP